MKLPKPRFLFSFRQTADRICGRCKTYTLHHRITEYNWRCDHCGCVSYGKKRERFKA